jgi:sugar/nucleoside kinase (ribokinase family)
MNQDCVDTVRLLLDKAPAVFKPPRFAMKGGETGSRVELAGVAFDEGSIADTTGAGDNFDAGFLHAWLKGAPLARCIEFGMRCARSRLRCMGGIEGQLAGEGQKLH